MKTNRREFLKTSAWLGAGVVASPLFVSSGVLAQPGVSPGANDRVNVGLIGLGGRCQWLYQRTIPEVRGMNVTAICDIFQPRIDSFMAQPNPLGAMTPYDDFRKMIETEKLDGVMVETTTHARGWVTVLAMQMGMHTYIEKPMCLTIAEGREMVKAARKYKSVTQVGTQQRSIPLNVWASRLVREGVLGKIQYVQAPNFVGPAVWDNKAEEPLPSGGKEGWWDLWTNQAEYRPYHRDLHLNWSKWGDYDAGGLCFGVSGWGTHSYDQINAALGTNETGPIAVLLEEPCEIRDSGKYQNRKVNDDETGADYYAMAKVVGPRAKMKMLFENGTELRLHLDADKGPGLGAIFVGEKGKLEINRDKIAANPKEILDRDDNPGKNPRDESADHVENWLHGIRTGERCVADVEYGQRSSTLCELVNIARGVGRVGETLHWDPVAERFTNCDEANAMLTRPRRQEFELPDLG